MPKLVWIGFYSVELCWRQTPFLRIFWTSAFSGVANWQQLEKVGHGYTTTNLPLSNGIKIISVLQCLHGEIGRIVSDVQKRDRQTDKTQRFWPPRRRVKSEPQQTWHGDRGPRARSCAWKTFQSMTHSFAATGRSKFGGTRPPQLKTP